LKYIYINIYYNQIKQKVKIMASLYQLTFRQFYYILKKQLLLSGMSIQRPLVTTNVYSITINYVEQLRVKSGLIARLLQLLSCGTGSYTVSRQAYNKLMYTNIQHVAAKMAVAILDRIFNEAKRLLSITQCVAAVVLLEENNKFGHLPSRALLASILVWGRKGVANDRNRTYKLAYSGTLLGCHHCQGMLAYCYWYGFNSRPNFAQAYTLAKESSDKGSPHGHYVLGLLYRHGDGVKEDHNKAVMLYRLAADQNLAEAQRALGYMYHNGYGVNIVPWKAYEYYQLADAQGYRVPL
jgi:TPR repeat protein